MRHIQFRCAALLTLAAALLLAGPALAQGCRGVMTPEYSTYVSYSVGASYTIYSTVVLDGSTEIGNTEYCNLSGVTHTPTVRDRLGSASGSGSGAPVSPAAYLSQEETEQIVGVPRVVYYESASADVYCSAVGEIYSWSQPEITLAIGVNRYLFTGHIDPNLGCEYDLTCANGNGAARCGTYSTDWIYDEEDGNAYCTEHPWIVTDWLIFNSNCDALFGPFPVPGPGDCQ